MALLNDSIVKEAVSNLEVKILEYFPDADISLIRSAVEFAAEKHGDQRRSSGEPYIVHPIGVSAILADLRLDLDSLITGILHDTVEDTETSLEEIQKKFGKSVAELVDGVTKISRITFRTSEEKQAENFRKMVVAMAKDLRVILVKLADRTHNMRTLDYLPERKRKLIAQETLDIYSPLAGRLGIHWIKAELEDLCLRYLKPEVYYRLAQLVSKKKAEREKYIEEVIQNIEENLKEYSINGAVTGRPKHFYSIYKKMESRTANTLDDIMDIVAFRIVLDNITECYKALGVIHAVYPPIPGRFKDYIAMPKPNNYQSLHTTVIGPFGERMEVQIRTQEMHQIAQSGIAAHWKYKEGRADVSTQNNMEWLSRLLDSQKSLKDPTEFLESVKLDLYPGDVFVFSPKGEVKEFPHGSTPLDFAYAVHTDVGNQCVGAKVNGRIVPLKYRLRSGDVVEILTSPTQHPSKDWLKLVKTSKAISKIRAFLKQIERAKARELGQEILEKEFRRYKTNLDKISKTSVMANGIRNLGYKSLDDLIVAVGYGKILPRDITKEVMPETTIEKEEDSKENAGFLQKIISTAMRKSEARNAVMVTGLGDVLIRFAKCCHPIPGDPIVGFVTRGRGVTVHHAACKKALDSDSARKIDVEWTFKQGKKVEKEIKVGPKRTVKVRVFCDDQPGMLASMTQTISGQGVNISQASVRTMKDSKAICVFEILVTGVEQLSKVISALEAKEGIISVERQRN
ncbi:MAG: bifunctional (p)ppGpp synthetase/guanosine-3',5'-bis(diphosphate) 3'-pyrophosphohydrolase [Oligoflexia bacterium]|nr:bifunctional (p)ppGpp synthetase/guanosine-3',5'-bis(diphosphate) 3'-pyrophosphohydrolase [Oligoflexia bacterium]